MNILRFIQDRIDKDSSGCWNWTGSKQSNEGYGFIRIAGKKAYVHRIMYSLLHGDIPSGMQILHSCDNPQCCNPDHLFAGTNKDNISDRVYKGRGKRLDKRMYSHEDAFILYKRGIPMRQLARDYGVSYGSLWHAMKKIEMELTQ